MLILRTLPDDIVLVAMPTDCSRPADIAWKKMRLQDLAIVAKLCSLMQCCCRHAHGLLLARRRCLEKLA